MAVKEQIAILEEAIKYLKQGWTQLRLARTSPEHKIDNGVSPDNCTAVCWCINGAICKTVSCASENYWYLFPDVRELNTRLFKVARARLEKIVSEQQDHPSYHKILGFLQDKLNTSDAMGLAFFYNDLPTTTQQDVISLCEEVLADLKGVADSDE